MKILILFIALSCTSCATVFNGKTTDCQRTKPKQGEPRREIKKGALIIDIFVLGAIPLIIDFATCSIYKKDCTPTPATPKK
jgi:hypothetical protein